MRSKISFKLSSFGVCLLGVIFFSTIIFFLSLDLHGQGSDSILVSSTNKQTTQKLKQASLGFRLKIPKINVDAAIESVGLTPKGAMDVPKDPKNAAWYNLGPRPGETGSAAISGHINWWYGATGVFANLYKLKPGDKITVQDDQGATVSFVVRATRKYNASADATNVFISNDGKAHLNLITCSGVWNKRAQQYSQRLVVFTDKEQV